MSSCEDFPCCGHELGCCPDFDPETGAQLNMVCVCGAKVPLTSSVSICDGCLRQGDEDEEPFYEDEDDYFEGDEDAEDADACADSCGDFHVEDEPYDWGYED